MMFKRSSSLPVITFQLRGKTLTGQVLSDAEAAPTWALDERLDAPPSDGCPHFQALHWYYLAKLEEEEKEKEEQSRGGEGPHGTLLVGKQQVAGAAVSKWEKAGLPPLLSSLKSWLRQDPESVPPGIGDPAELVRRLEKLTKPLEVLVSANRLRLTIKPSTPTGASSGRASSSRRDKHSGAGVESAHGSSRSRLRPGDDADLHGRGGEAGEDDDEGGDYEEKEDEEEEEHRGAGNGGEGDDDDSFLDDEDDVPLPARRKQRSQRLRPHARPSSGTRPMAASRPLTSPTAGAPSAAKKLGRSASNVRQRLLKKMGFNPHVPLLNPKMAPKQTKEEVK